MKLVSIVLAIALAACAGTSNSKARSPSSNNARNLDYEKMAQVDARALARGVDVIWVNPPTKN